MHELLVLRHAKSSWKDSALDDHERPLKERGRREAPLVGQRMREEGLVPDLVLCSSARRARQTWKRVQRGGGFDDVPSRIEPALYHPGVEEILAIVAGLPASSRRALLVGHNPELEELLERLCGEPVRLPTAALARVALPGAWASPDGARLLSVWRPRNP